MSASNPNGEIMAEHHFCSSPWECIDIAFREWKGSRPVIISLDKDTFSVAVHLTREADPNAEVQMDFSPTVQCDDVHVLHDFLEEMERRRLIEQYFVDMVQHNPEENYVRMQIGTLPTRDFYASILPTKRAQQKAERKRKPRKTEDPFARLF